MARATSPVRSVGGVGGVVVGVVAITLAGAGAGLALGLDRSDRWALARSVGLLLPLVVLNRRSGRPVERDLWRNLRTAVTVLTVGSALDLVLRLTVSTAADYLFGVAVLLACAFTYRGLLAWNRVESAATARTDWLNGVGAVLAGSGLANLLVSAFTGTSTGTSAPVRAVHLQLVLGGWSALVVLLGATIGVGRAGRFLRDVRPWVLGASLALVAVLRSTGVLEVITGSELPRVEVGWLFVGLAMAVCALLPRHEVPARRPAVAGLFLSSVTVAVVAVVVLTAATRSSPDRNGTAVVLAVLALLVVGTRVGHLVGVLTTLLRSHEEAHTDDLTGLANRRGLLGAIARTPDPSLVVVDLTRFREVDGRHGHATGDDVLRSASLALRTAAPDGALTARLGGAELAVLLRGGATRRHAERILTALRTTVVGGRTFDLGPAAGLAEGSSGPLELLRRAHVAVHHAGVGTVRVYDHDTDRAERGRAQLVEELLTAFGPHHDPAARDRFEVHYQPQVAADGDVSGAGDGTVTGVEALVRWRHPRLGLLTPTSFLPLVEARELMRPFTAHVARRAVADLARWQRQGFDLTLSVNTSTSCLSSPFLLPLLDEVIAGGIRGDRLVVEVTETTLMADPARALAVCRAITDRGCGLSIDDYGTGYSSLAYLADLPATELKIDRTFTARLLRDERIAAIVAATVELAHQLGLRAVAEGVEDPATLRRLQAMGCDASQGYLHTAALPAHRLPTWLRERATSGRVAPPLARD